MRRTYEIKDLEKYRYPNLIAEIMESGYSICTLSERMGHGPCAEDNTYIREKLFGKEEITASEALGLSQLFAVKAEYLFSRQLAMCGDKPLAYYRHFESNHRQEKEQQRIKAMEEINRALEQKPHLLEIIKSILSMTEEQVDKMIQEA